MTKEELEKFQFVIETMDHVCPSHYEFKEFDYCCLKDSPDCLKCWKFAIKNELNKLEESNV